MNIYECYIDEKVKADILDAINNHYDFDSWGDVEYGNDHIAVDYNISIDNSTEETIYQSAFYRLVKNADGLWQHDGCTEWYEYNIDFSDEDWEEKLKEEAIKSYEKLWKGNEYYEN